MKYLIFLLFVILKVNLFSQTEEINLFKYWKFRDDFREYFIRIGSEQGQSIAARAFLPLGCIDNVPANSINGYNFGTMHFGDAMIRHGYYLSLLATEYALLKKNKEDTKGVLNELYFALNAVNRLDRIAEPELAKIYNFTLKDSLNGFYIREDVPADFGEKNWGKSKLEIACIDSPFSTSNNAGKVHKLPDLWMYPASYQNSPSNDQLSSLMMGYRMVHTLVDEQFVQPEGEKQGFYIQQEICAQVDRMMTYLETHEWYYIDVNGWPVNNGGGDMLFTTLPLIIIAQKITGHTYKPTMRRNLEAYKNQMKIQHAITGKGVKNDLLEEQLKAIKSVSKFPVEKGYKRLKNGANYGEENSLYHSEFQEFMFGKGGRTIHMNITKNLWDKHLPLFFIDYLDNNRFNRGLLPFELLKIKFMGEGTPNDDNNILLLSNYAMSADLWDMKTISSIGKGTGNYQMELMHNVLNGHELVRNQSFYKALLDSMPFSGAFNLTQNTINSEGELIEMNATQKNGWGAESRWHNAEEMHGGNKNHGIFNNLDYMLFHNLYLLAFDSNTKFNYKSSFYLDSSLSFKIEPKWKLTDEASREAELFMTLKLKKVHFQTENVFGQNSDFPIYDTKHLLPYFSEYSKWGIFTTDFLTLGARVESNASLIIENNFQICNQSSLIVMPNGNLELKKGSTRIQNGSTLYIRGTLIIHPEANLIVESGGILLFENKAIVHQIDDQGIVKLAGASISQR